MSTSFLISSTWKQLARTLDFVRLRFMYSLHYCYKQKWLVHVTMLKASSISYCTFLRWSLGSVGSTMIILPSQQTSTVCSFFHPWKHNYVCNQYNAFRNPFTLQKTWTSLTATVKLNSNVLYIFSNSCHTTCSLVVVHEHRAHVWLFSWIVVVHEHRACVLVAIWLNKTCKKIHNLMN